MTKNREQHEAEQRNSDIRGLGRRGGKRASRRKEVAIMKIARRRGKNRSSAERN